jgi:hypothetical protein
MRRGFFFLLIVEDELPCFPDTETATVSTAVLPYCLSRAHYSDMKEIVRLTRVESH